MNRYRDTILQKNRTTGIGIRTFVPANMVRRQDQFQACTAISSLIELNHGEEVIVDGPVPGTLYQAFKAEKTLATPTVFIT
jgi:hypothetical protein